MMQRRFQTIVHAPMVDIPASDDPALDQFERWRVCEIIARGVDSIRTACELELDRGAVIRLASREQTLIDALAARPSPAKRTALMRAAFRRWA